MKTIRSRSFECALSTFAFISLVACTSLAKEQVHGEEFRFQWNGFSEAAKATTFSPAFYIPVIVGAVAYFDSAGARVSQSARRHQPFWGDIQRASRSADNMRTATSISMAASSLLFAEHGVDYVASNLAFDVFTSFSSVQIRGLVRDGNRRNRPNGSSGSFPSGHATAVGSRVALANENIFRSDLSDQVKCGWATANWLTAYLVAYARIESHNHYPEDVLAGIALGYWTSLMIKRTLTNTFPSKNLDISVSVPQDFSSGFQVGLAIR